MFTSIVVESDKLSDVERRLLSVTLRLHMMMPNNLAKEGRSARKSAEIAIRLTAPLFPEATFRIEEHPQAPRPPQAPPETDP